MLLRSKQYAEQMECVVLSENGIVTVNTRRSNSNSGCTPSDVEKYINKLKKYRKYSLSQKIELKNILEKTIDSLQGKSNCSYQEESELTVMQTNLVRLLQEALLLLKEGE